MQKVPLGNHRRLRMHRLPEMTVLDFDFKPRADDWGIIAEHGQPIYDPDSHQ